ncbi:MAG TPA: sulfite oxidase-like oxidoreductase [Chloroflexota bacterium]|nr:sulfite oxidase-like oxidoreductase [Chloroflexota bacterium]
MVKQERRERERAARQSGRLPPGQALTERWPVLSATPPPRFDKDRWRFRVHGLVDHARTLTYDEFVDLPHVEVRSDIHCVTRWSRLDNVWEGVAFRTIAELVQPRPEARFVLVRCMVPYSSNLPLEECLRDDVLFAHSHDGRPLLPEHGWPLRLVVPQRYFWKSAKWVNEVLFMDKDQLGFWEKLGYHNVGDPWKEQRNALNLRLRIPRRFRTE